MERRIIFNLTKEKLGEIINAPGEVKYMEVNNSRGILTLYIEGDQLPIRPELGSTIQWTPEALPIDMKLNDNKTYHFVAFDWDELLEKEE